jgi:hypothetical protein
MKKTVFQWIKDLIASFDSLVQHNKSMGAEQSTGASKPGESGDLQTAHATRSSFSGGISSQNSVEDRLPDSGSAAALALLRDGALSPRQDSVCSDTDQPFVSYTVNKPIGDSPKKTAPKTRSKFSSPRLSRTQSRLAKSTLNTLVTVNNLKISNEIKYDEDLIRLQEIPVFLPILQEKDKNNDILSRLDPGALNGLLQSYQDHMRTVAARTAAEQGYINKKIREIETDVVAVTNNLQDRQKRYEKYCEKMSVVRDISRTLAKCHMLLNENIDMMDALNSSLPQDLRLEPFVWTTG